MTKLQAKLAKTSNTVPAAAMTRRIRISLAADGEFFFGETIPSGALLVYSVDNIMQAAALRLRFCRKGYAPGLWIWTDFDSQDGTALAGLYKASAALHNEFNLRWLVAP